MAIVANSEVTMHPEPCIAIDPNYYVLQYKAPQSRLVRWYTAKGIKGYQTEDMRLWEDCIT